GVSPAGDPSPQPEQDAQETTQADKRTTGLTPGPHVMAHLREALRRRGVRSTAEVRRAPDGLPVRTAGHVIVRQRPGSAKGFCFVTLEDETGTANGVLTPDAFQRLRVPLHASALLLLEGRVQNVDGVVHVRVADVRPLDAHALPAAHDYR
ncbi:MAG: OB-fold nucleic acid binding domain-containing protein, partial [Myxococcota bacterium]|nr:OB-fold nucleic acid binding domain-containing protein [Myxococcota bacterium]